MKVAFDSRPAADPRGIGRYARCLLDALRELGVGEVVEARRPEGADVFHSPWIDGALLRPTCPMVVTLHDLVPLKRPGDYLRTGLRFRMRYLAVRRAARVIVPTRAVAEDARRRLGIPPERLAVIHEAAAPAFSARSAEQANRMIDRGYVALALGFDWSLFQCGIAASFEGIRR